MVVFACISMKVDYSVRSAIVEDVRTGVIEEVENQQADILVLGSRGVGAIRGYTHTGAVV